MEVELETKVLADGYYLDNFLRLLDFVYDRYNDLLTDEEIAFHNEFKLLSINSQRLYVRLISRKGPYFRMSKLNYSEIPDLNAAAEELVEEGFLFLNPKEGVEFAIDVFLIDELRSIGSNLGIEKADLVGGKRLVQSTLLEFDEEELWQQFEDLDHLVVPAHYTHMNVYMLLFFGNSHQTLSDFILEDIGVLRYENYSIHEESRCFENREDLEQFIFINQVRQEFWFANEMGDTMLIDQLAGLVNDKNFSDLHEKRSSKLNYDFGSYYEKNGYFEEAIELYSRSKRHPANERIVRILDKQEKHSEALDTLEHLIKTSNNYDELLFAHFFIEGQKRKLGLDYVKQKRLKLVSEEIILEKHPEQTIEVTVVNHFVNQGVECFYTENVLWRGIFALVFWDIMFKPLKGVFYNPFQRGPNDLRSSDFRLKRSAEIDHRLEQVKQGKYTGQILETYREKWFTANSMISWKQLSYEQLESVLSVVPAEHMCAILDRMAFNLGEYSSGFPDIFMFSDNSYKLLEVKGPGDQLRNNQRQWLKYFDEKGIPAKVISVKWN